MREGFNRTGRGWCTIYFVEDLRETEYKDRYVLLKMLLKMIKLAK